MFSIPGVKGIEFGTVLSYHLCVEDANDEFYISKDKAGCSTVNLNCSDTYNREISKNTPENNIPRTRTNHSGGINGV